MVVAPTAMFDWGESKPQCVQYGARRTSVLDIGDDSWIGAGEKRGTGLPTVEPALIAVIWPLVCAPWFGERTFAAVRLL